MLAPAEKTHDQVLISCWRRGEENGQQATGTGDCDRHPHRLPVLMALSQRIDAAKDEEDRDMMALRSFLLEIQEQVQVSSSKRKQRWRKRRRLCCKRCAVY